MSSNLSVAAIMPTFNSEKFLIEAIVSILAQSFDNFKLFILDGGSTDATLDICHILKGRDSRIEVLKFADTTPTYRVNRILADTAFDYYLMAHSDDVSVPHRFERQIEFMETGKGLVISGSSIHFWMHEKLNPQSVTHHAGFLPFPLNHADILARLPFWWCFSIPSLILNGTALKSMKLSFDERFDVASDWWFYWRAAREGRVANLEEPLVSYRQHYASHGPTNLEKIAVEARKIRTLIAEEIGLPSALSGEQMALFLDLIVEYDRIVSPAFREDVAALLRQLIKFLPDGIDPAVWASNIEGMAGKFQPNPVVKTSFWRQFTSKFRLSGRVLATGI